MTVENAEPVVLIEPEEQLPPKPTRTMRVDREVYNKLSSLKKVYARKAGKRHASFSELLEECALIAQAYMTQHARWVVGSQLYSSIEEARGAAISLSVKSKKPAQPPELVVSLVKDDYFR